jgi:carbon starvation protein
VARFILQDFLGNFVPALGRTGWYPGVLATSAGVVGAWGYFLYQGTLDPLGGINSMWPLFGIANQMLAGIALTFCCVVLVRMKRERYVWIPLLPTLWLLVCTMTAGWQKIFNADPKIGFLANARKFSDAIARGELAAPAKSLADMERLVFNNHLNAALCALFMSVLLATVAFGLRAAWQARASAQPTAREIGGAAGAAA